LNSRWTQITESEFDTWLDRQLAELALTRDELRAWRPAAPVRGRRRARVAA
jgi:hypothetical protein